MKLLLPTLMFGMISLCSQYAIAQKRADFKPLDEIIEAAIAAGKCPNADIIVGRRDEILYQQQYGNAWVKPERKPLLMGQIFDLASLTKPVATATSIMILHERGKLNIHDPVAKYIPTFAMNGKESVTIEQCLLHIGGFIPDNPMSDYADGGPMAIERIKAAPLKYKTGEDFRYSDVGYIVLGEVVKMVDGRPLDQFAKDEIFTPLMMLRTSYNTPFELLAVPTESIKGNYLAGKVHDPRAAAMGGVAGHAGLFSTTQDLARYCQMLLNGGEIKGGKRILKPETVAEMTKPRPAGKDGVLRTYGFDCVSSYDSPRGNLFPKGTSFGHTGFTGGSIWIDPESGVYVVLLTSRLHPDGKGDVKQLRSDVATKVAEIVLGK